MWDVELCGTKILATYSHTPYSLGIPGFLLCIVWIFAHHRKHVRKKYQLQVKEERLLNISEHGGKKWKEVVVYLG